MLKKLLKKMRGLINCLGEVRGIYEKKAGGNTQKNKKTN
jgi:hypothetical protein